MARNDNWRALPRKRLFDAHTWHTLKLPVEKVEVTAERRVQVSDNPVEWPGHESEGTFEVDDDSNTHEQVIPATYAFYAPRILTLLPPVIVAWVIDNFTPRSLETTRGLLDSDEEFSENMMAAYESATKRKVSR